MAIKSQRANRGRRLVDEAISFVTMASIREAIDERNRRLDEYTGAPERADRELTLRQQLVSDLYESRMQITR